jgi:hypothetical protein
LFQLIHHLASTSKEQLMAADEEAVVAAPQGPAIAGVNGRMCVSVSVPVCTYIFYLPQQVKLSNTGSIHYSLSGLISEARDNLRSLLLQLQHYTMNKTLHGRWH